MQQSFLADHRSALAARPPAEPWFVWIGVMMLYLLVGIGWTWPLVLHWDSGVIQLGVQPVDSGQNSWNLWWSLVSLRAGWNPFTTAYLFFPQTIDLFWQTLGLSNALSVLPITALAGPIAALNTVILLSFALGGLFAYRIARGLVERGPALLGGLVFVIAPYHFPPIYGGALEIAAVHWLPLLVLLLMRALNRPGLLHMLPAGMILGLTSLSSHYYGLFGAVYVAAHGGLAALLSGNRRQCLALLAVTGGVLLSWLALLLPFLDLGSALGSVETSDWFARQLFHSAALVDLLPFNVFHPLWGDAAATVFGALHPFGVELGLAPGLLVYLLLGVALLRRRAFAWPWLLLGLLMLLLAMGPRLKITDQPTGLPLPYALLDLLGPFRNSTRPSRFVALMMLPVAVLSALGAAGLRDWLRVPPLRLTVVLALLLALELAVRPWPILALRVAPLYQALRDDPVPGAILELPPGLNDSRQMLNQLCHGRPLAGGYLARTPDYPPVNYDSAMRRLWRISPSQPDIFRFDPAGELAAYAIRFVTLDHSRLSANELAILRAELAAAGIEQQSREPVELYRIDPATARPQILPGDGWYAAETNGDQIWRWMGEQARLRLLSPAPAIVALQLELGAYDTARPLEISLAETIIFSDAIAAAPERRALRLLFAVPAGSSELRLHSTAELAPDGRALSLIFGSLTVKQIAALPGATPLTPVVMPAAAGSLCTVR
jgi:hypothetical protein